LGEERKTTKTKANVFLPPRKEKRGVEWKNDFYAQERRNWLKETKLAYPMGASRGKSSPGEGKKGRPVNSLMKRGKKGKRAACRCSGCRRRKGGKKRHVLKKGKWFRLRLFERGGKLLVRKKDGEKEDGAGYMAEGGGKTLSWGRKVVLEKKGKGGGEEVRFSFLT